MRRCFALAPALLAAASLALSCAIDASAKDAPPKKKAQATSARPGAAKKIRKRKKGASKSYGAAGAAQRSWGDFDVHEGTLASPIDGAVCPAEMASVEGRFCVDRWEASLVEVVPDGRDVPWPPFGPLEEGHRFRAVSVPNVYPQAYISGAQAARACAAAGKRLCAPVEWRKACAGPRAQTFGYGDARVEGRCNDAGKSPMMELYPRVAISWTLVGMTEMNDPMLNQIDGTLAPTGSHDACRNDWGVYDMVGNLHEWTDDPSGTFQGGYYLDTHKNGDGCTYRTVAHEFTYHDYSTGFRCCADPIVP